MDILTIKGFDHARELRDELNMAIDYMESALKAIEESRRDTRGGRADQ